jgi:hypothetical protein
VSKMNKISMYSDDKVMERRRVHPQIRYTTTLLHVHNVDCAKNTQKPEDM